MNASDAYAVALKDVSSGPLAPAGFLAGRGYTPDSARDFMRGQPGFLGRAMTLAGARELCAAASAAGLAAILIRESDIPYPPTALKTVKIEPKTGGFHAVAGGAVKFIPYESVSLIAAAAFDSPVAPPRLEALKNGLFSGLIRLAGGRTFEPVREAGMLETFFRADIIAEEGTLRLLLEPENLDFSPLGTDLSHSSLENFRTLLRRISAPCFGAVKNRFLQAFLSSRPLSGLKIASPEAAGNELSRLMLLSSEGASYRPEAFNDAPPPVPREA